MFNVRQYQHDAVQSVFDYFESGENGNPIICVPTGGGKSLIMADLCRRVMTTWPNQRILLLAHRKELLEQNAEKIFRHYPGANVGIYSAGMKKRQLGRAITVAGIQSVYKKAKQLGWQALVLIDEAHRIPKKGNGMYLRLLRDLHKTNPQLKCIGLTASPFRLDSGLLTEGEDRIFTDICYNISLTELIRDGYLCPLVSKSSVVQADLSGVHKRGGEFIESEAERAMDDATLINAALDEAEKYCADRKSWLVFCSGVTHAEHVTQALRDRAIACEIVTGETIPMLRELAINKFKSGEIRALVSVNVFLEGFDAPNTDAILMLRPTCSAGLFIQALGRGMRPHPQKNDCIVLDFAGNFERFGPIDQIEIRSKKDGAAGVTVPPSKICPDCQTPLHARTRECTCGHQFPDEPIVKHETEASDVSPISNLPPGVSPVKEYDVRDVEYFPHKGKKGIPSMRVSYDCGFTNFTFDEWVCFQHEGFVRRKAESWWTQHGGLHPVPATVTEALARTDELKPVTKIYVKRENGFNRVVSFSNIQPALTPLVVEDEFDWETEAVNAMEAEKKLRFG